MIPGWTGGKCPTHFNWSRIYPSKMCWQCLKLLVKEAGLFDTRKCLVEITESVEKDTFHFHIRFMQRTGNSIAYSQTAF